jgi:hypothetical protein
MKRNFYGMILLLLFLCSCSPSIRATRLAPESLHITDSKNNQVKQVADGNIDTVWSSQDAKDYIIIDLKEPKTLYRIFLTPGDNKKQALGSVTVSLQKTLNDTGATVIQANNIYPSEVNLRFNPTEARYIKIQPGKEHGKTPWSIAELEIYGTHAPMTPKDAVVLDAKAPEPLQFAAEELSYYLSELTGNPVPVVKPEEAKQYPGNLYRIVDLKKLAPDYATMQENIKKGLLPEDINIERKGREVIFKAWPYRNVLWSVWEFLNRQGVRWVYPDAHGDYVPYKKSVDLSFLPLHLKPSTDFIYANFSTEKGFLTKPRWIKQNMGDGYLYFWRNRWTHSWGGAPMILGGKEVPKKPATNYVIRDEFKESMNGFPHNFNGVLPSRILKKHPSWCGLWKSRKNIPSWVQKKVPDEKIGKRIPPSEGGPSFCMSNPEVIDFVANKIIEHSKAGKHRGLYWLLPMDACKFCECDRCLAMNTPVEKNTIAWVANPESVSDVYYKFIEQVALKVKKENPNLIIGALAYANVHKPPRNISKLPDNVCVQVCMYGHPNLPIDSPMNMPLKNRWLDWAKKATHLENYSYVLLNEASAEDNKMPFPLVAGIVNQNQFLYKLGGLKGGSQANPAKNLPYNPWNYYAYPRSMYDAKLSAEKIKDEFFPAYFGEAAKPMRAYYDACEKYHVDNNITLHSGGYQYNVTPGSYSIELLKTMQQHLNEAEKQAKSWITKERVARVREGYNHLLEVKGITPDNFKTPDGFASIEPGGKPVIIAGQKVRIWHPIKKSKRNLKKPDVDWILWRTLERGDYVHFKKGTYKITVSLKTWKNEKQNAGFDIWVGKVKYGPFEFKKGIKADHTVEQEITVDGIYPVLVKATGAAFSIKDIKIESTGVSK